MQKSVETRINDIIATIIYCSESDVQPDKHLYYDLLADSLMITDIILALEVEFNLQMSDAELANVNYVRDLYQLIAMHMR